MFRSIAVVIALIALAVPAASVAQQANFAPVDEGSSTKESIAQSNNIGRKQAARLTGAYLRSEKAGGAVAGSGQFRCLYEPGPGLAGEFRPLDRTQVACSFSYTQREDYTDQVLVDEQWVDNNGDGDVIDDGEYIPSYVTMTFKAGTVRSGVSRVVRQDDGSIKTHVWVYLS